MLPMMVTTEVQQMATRITEVFQVEVGLDDLPYEEGDDLGPQSLQPVIFTNDDGERQIELMRWALELAVTVA
jgi:hypothetical protein